MNVRLLPLAAGLIFSAGMVAAQTDAGTTQNRSATQAASPAMVDGEVRKIDKSAGKITIKHGEIKHLQMPPMTMVFKAKDTAMLDQVKPGDRIRFAVESGGGALIVTAIEVAK